MELTRHFVATVYVVNDGATALHKHERLGLWLPPGGHLDRDELPHEAACREVAEEIGLDVGLVAGSGGVETGTVQSLPRPQHFLLEDIIVHDDGVSHQHIDFIFYGVVDSRAIDPGPDEAPAEAWEWFTPAELDAAADRLPEDVVEIGKNAIDALDGR